MSLPYRVFEAFNEVTHINLLQHWHVMGTQQMGPITYNGFGSTLISSQNPGTEIKKVFIVGEIFQVKYIILKYIFIIKINFRTVLDFLKVVRVVRRVPTSPALK